MLLEFKHQITSNLSLSKLNDLDSIVIFRQSPPSIPIGSSNISSYYLMFYIRTDGLKFARY